MNAPISDAARIPTLDAAPTLSVNPITLAAPDRYQPLEMRVTAPVDGDELPIVLLSHGGGSSRYLPSKDGYAPLADFYAARGFVVIQPTHESAKVGGRGLDRDAPGFPMFWRSRIADMTLILDRLDTIAAQVPTLAGRLDPERVAAVGHSGGTQTVAMLLGARLANGEAGVETDLLEPRIKAGILLAPLGNGGESLTDSVRQRFPELDLDFSHMTTPTLVAFGDADESPQLTVRGADWHADPFHHGPGAEHLLTLIGARHGLGGIMGYDAAETDDADTERLAVTQRMTWAYLRSSLFPGDAAWSDAQKALDQHAASQGRVESKR